MLIHHQTVQFFLSVFMMNRRNDHSAGINAHHRTGRQVCDCNQCLSYQLFRLISIVDAA